MCINNTKKNEDIPAAPKRPTNAYFIFMNTIIKELQEKEPTKKRTELMKEIGVMWKDMTDDEQ